MNNNNNKVSIINLSVRRPVGTIMFFVGIILLGMISCDDLSVNLLPDLSYPKITIVTYYKGSGPEEIERFITSQLEAPLSSISGVKKINSVSKEGVSIITLEFHWGTDMDFAMLHTKEKVEEVKSLLPDDYEDPIIMEMDPTSAPIMIVILTSNEQTVNVDSQKETAEFIIKPRLEQLEGISAVEIRGGNIKEISVEIEPEKVKSFGVTLSEVSNSIRQNNSSPSGGLVKKDKYKYTLKIEGELKSPEEIEEVVVKNLEGRNVRIRDIGRAFYKDKLKDGDIRFNSSSAISLLLFRESGGNTVNATKDAEIALENLKKELKNIDFIVVAKEAELIISSINSLQLSLGIGAGLAFLVLLFFLQKYRDPLMIFLAIPISIVATFVLMFAFKISINIMSLGGLVLGVGMFVDNCIIVLESIFRHRDKDRVIDTVINGTKEVSGAITASTFTTISIFLPVIYLYGITGKLFTDQAATVSFSLISSLFVAVTLLPALSAITTFSSSKLKDDQPTSEASDKPKKSWINWTMKGFNYILLIPFKIIGYNIYYIFGGVYLVFKYIIKGLGIFLDFFFQPLFKIFNKFYSQFETFYHKILEGILNRKIIAFYISIFILLSILGTFLLLDKELLPSPDTSKFEIKANTIPAFGFEETNKITIEIEKKLMGIKGINFVFTESGAVSKEAGRSEDISVNSIHFIVKCQSPEIRPTVMSQTRNILNSYLFLPESDSKSNNMFTYGGVNPGLQDFSVFLEQNTFAQYLYTGGDNFQVKVFYDDINLGKQAADLILREIKEVEGLDDLKTTTTAGKPTFAINFKQELLNELNITKEGVSNFINQAVRGEQAGEVKKVQKNFDIYVRVPVEGIMEMKKLLSLPIPINDSTYFLGDLIDIETRPSVKRIEKERQNKFFLISADVKTKDLNQIIKKVEKRLEAVDLPPNTRAMISGEEEERRKAFDSLTQAIWLAIILVYMIMAAKFENIVQPLMIMFTVPMGLVGAFLFLLITGNTLSIISGIGIMVLIGIGVNDAIVKVEYSNQLRKAGKGVREAVMTASRVRLRPILMTTFTTICGVLPMAVMTQTGSELQRPLALVIVGGLLFTTYLTLILIPVLYELLENFREKKKVTSET